MTLTQGDRIVYTVRLALGDEKDIHGTVTRSNDTVTTFRDEKDRIWTVPTRSLRRA